MKRFLPYGAVFLAGLGLASAFFTRRVDTPAKARVPALSAAGPQYISAPGRVEPVSEEIRIGSQLTGKLQSVLVDEGSLIRRGQVIAVLDNADYAARVSVAEAQLRQAEAILRRVENGARRQERSEALAAVKEAEAVLANAQAERQRREALFASGDISRADVERTEREQQVAKSRLEAARERHSFIDSDAREEDRAKAQADVALAAARLAETRALLGKTVIRSPLDGIVLRRHLKSGEMASDKPDSPIVTVGNSSVLRVRAEIDETDVARVQAGQRAYVTAGAYGDRKFRGRVVRVGQVVGRKNVTTERPAERVDTKVLETLIELDAGETLPAGLRVDAFIG